MSLTLSIPANAARGPLLAQPGLKPPTRCPKGNYEWVQDLTAHAPVKVNWYHHYDHTCKLQFIGVSNLDANAILTTIRDIFDVDPLDLHLVRVDFAVDLPIRMEWFAQNMTVERKRRKDGFGRGTTFSRCEGTTLILANDPA